MAEYNPAPANKRVNEIPMEHEDSEVKMRKITEFLDTHQPQPDERDIVRRYLQAHPNAAVYFEPGKMTLRDLNGRTSTTIEV